MRQKLQNKKRKECPTLRNPFFIFCFCSQSKQRPCKPRYYKRPSHQREEKATFFTNLFNIDPVYTSTSTCRKKHQQVGEPTETPPHLADYIQFAPSQPTEKPAETGRNHTQASISPYPPIRWFQIPIPSTSSIGIM